MFSMLSNSFHSDMLLLWHASTASGIIQLYARICDVIRPTCLDICNAQLFTLYIEETYMQYAFPKVFWKRFAQLDQRTWYDEDVTGDTI